MKTELIPDISLDNSGLEKIVSPNLDQEQDQAVQQKQGKILVSGFAGTGKTLVLAENVIKQIENGISSNRIMIFCFSRNQVKMMRKYLSRRLSGFSIPQVSTFHSFTHSIMQSALNQGILNENYSLSPLRLLSGPEQEVVISELIKGSIEDNSINWPENLKPALLTKGFVRQVRNLLARMRNLGMDPEQLIETGIKYENENWISLGHFAEMYLDNLDSSESTDYAEIVHRVNLLLLTLKDLKQINLNYTHFYVDEYQDIDASQVRLLKTLVKPDKFLFCAGEKSESIYQFRGADFAAIDRFVEDFGEVKKIVLKNNYRTKSQILEEINTFDTSNSQFFNIANTISRYKQENFDSKWSDILIILRNSNSINSLTRALNNYSIPVTIDAEDLPLIKDPAARVLIDCLTIAAEFAHGEENSSNVQLVGDLLKGPLINAPAFELRECARLFRKNAKEKNLKVLSSEQSIYHAIKDANYLNEISHEISQSLRILAGVIHTAKDLIRSKQRVEIVLWSIWNYEISEKNRNLFKIKDFEYKWSENLRNNCFKTGIEAKKSDRDLDAVLALFDAAAREDERTLGTRGVLNFISDLGKQSFQAETIAQKPIEDERVQIVTAHKAKGLEAKFVILPDLQEEVWPSNQIRNSLLEVERLGYETLVRAPSKLEILEEEKRLFEVAKSRAKNRILLTAVSNEFSTHAQPSKFLTQNPNLKILHHVGMPHKPLSLNFLVANLRKMGQNQNNSVIFRKSIAQRLAKINESRDVHKKSISFASNPDNWWATLDKSKKNDSEQEIENVITLSASSLATLRDCSLKWFYEKKAGANLVRKNSATIGSIVHALAQGITTGQIEPNIESLQKNLDLVWPQLQFEADWISQKEYLNTLETLRNLILWHQNRSDKKILGSEVYFSFEMNLKEIKETIKISGFIDRVESDLINEENIHIIDFKTSKNEISYDDALVDPQLAIYRLAVQRNSLHGLDLAKSHDESASLVYLKKMTRKGVSERNSGNTVESQILETIKDAVKVISNKEYKASPSELCRSCNFKKMCPAQTQGQSVIS